MAKPLVTIAIPTWNRAKDLRAMITSVTAQAKHSSCEDLVEIVVSDNASTDDTGAVVEELAGQTSVNVRYSRNETNLGTIRNIFRTIQMAEGEYWFFYGDDDIVIDGALREILRAIADHSDIAVFLFNNVTMLGEGSSFLPEFGTYTAEEAARKYFYYLGNAGVLAIRTTLAKEAVSRWGERMQSWWPQTEVAFAAMVLASVDRPVAAARIDATLSPNHTRNVVYTSWYIWETMLVSLLNAARELRDIVGPPLYRQACACLLTPRRVVQLAGSVLLYTTFFDREEELRRTRREAWRSIAESDALTFLPLFLMWFIAVLPRVVKKPVLWLGIALRWPGQIPARVRWIREKQRSYEEKRAAAAGSQASRVYTPKDL